MQIHPPAVSIRMAAPDDADAITTLLLAAFAEIKAVYTPGGFDATVLDATRIKTRMDEGPLWIATDENSIAGTVAAMIKPSGLYMRGMAVHPQYRGMHIGDMLLDTVIAYAYEHDCPRIFLSTAPYLHSAIRLYEKRGFIRNDEAPHELFGTPLFTMEKQLHT